MKKEFYYASRDTKTQIHAVEWVPEGDVKGILQICHGMAEHIERYDDFAKFLAKQGVYVVGNDHLGHGKSVTSKEKLGYFSKDNGNAVVIADIQQLRMQTEKKYPGIPYFMLGHSMGSFLLRQYLGLYSGGLSGAIIMGTGAQPNMILYGGKLVCRLVALFKGADYRSNFVNQMAVGAYEKKWGLGWLSRNQENVQNYKNDPLCGFVFTVNAYYHMFSGMLKMNQQERAKKTAKNLPIFFVAGQEDPVGNYGKSVEKVFHSYQKGGYQDVKMKLYPNDRHEILNEDDRETVYQDIFGWIDSILKK